MDIKNIFPLVLVLLFWAGCSQNNDTLPFYNTADLTAEWIAPTDAAYASIHQIAPFSFRNQLGQIINSDSLRGHIYLANFFFSSCPIVCPRMMGNLDTVQRVFKKNKQVKLVSFSVMPWVDSVKRLYQYGKDHGINPQQWYLLTGNKNRIYKLSRESYFSEKKPGLSKAPDSFLHTESLLLIDKKSRIRGVYNATDTAQIKRVIADMELLLKE